MFAKHLLVHPPAVMGNCLVLVTAVHFITVIRLEFKGEQYGSQSLGDR